MSKEAFGTEASSSTADKVLSAVLEKFPAGSKEAPWIAGPLAHGGTVATNSSVDIMYSATKGKLDLKWHEISAVADEVAKRYAEIVVIKPNPPQV